MKKKVEVQMQPKNWLGHPQKTDVNFYRKWCSYMVVKKQSCPKAGEVVKINLRGSAALS